MRPFRLLFFNAWLLSGWVWCPGTARAQQEADYAGGFALLLEAGLPDIKGWQWVSLENWQDHSQWQLRSFLGEDFSLSGTGWLQAEADTDGLRRFAPPGSLSLAAYFDERSQTERAQEFYQIAMKQGLSFASGKSQEADEKADVTALLERVTQALEKGAERHPGVLPPLLITAAQWHQRGFKTEANQLAARLLGAAPEPGDLVRAVVASLADARLNVALAKFQNSGNWESLAEELRRLQTDFAVNWPRRPLAERLLAQIAPYLSGTGLPPVQSEEFSLSEKQQEWWRRISSAQPVQTDEQSWQVASAPGMAVQRWLSERLELPASESKSGPPDELWHFPGDEDWITLFAAALGDELPVLTPGFQPEHFGRQYYNDDFGDLVGEWDEDKIEEAWSQLNRPRTRGELAAALLKQMLPVDGDSMSEEEMISPETIDQLRESAREWQTKWRDKPVRELARRYFDEGDRNQKSLALRSLVRVGDAGDRQEIEEKLLQEPEQTLDLTQNYVKELRGEAKGFLERFKPAFIAAYGRMMGKDAADDEAALLASLPDYVKGQITALENLAGGRGLDEVLADYLEDRADDSVLYAALSSEQEGDEPDPRPIVEKLLATAAGLPASAASKQVRMLNLSQQMIYRGSRDDEGQTAAGLPEWLRAALLPLTGEEAAQAMAPNWDGSRQSVQDHAAFLAVAAAWSRFDAQLMQKLRSLPPEDFWAAMAPQGIALIEGKEPPPLPDPAALSEARRDELRQAVGSARGQAWLDFAGALDAAEKLAVLEMLKEADPDETWKAQVIKLSRVVPPEGDAAAAETWSFLKDRTLDAGWIDELLKAMQTHGSKGGAALRAAVSPRPLRQGMQVLFMDPATAEHSGGRQGGSLAHWLKTARDPEQKPEFTAVLSTALNYRRQYQQSVWRLAPEGWEELTETGEWPGFRNPPPLNIQGGFEDIKSNLNSLLESWNPNSDNFTLVLEFLPVPDPEPN